MLPREQPDRIHVTFDDHRLVANAGRFLPVTLAHHLGLGELVDRHLGLGEAAGRANAADKILTLMASAVAGGDCIDDAFPVYAGGTEQVPDARSRLHRRWGRSCTASGGTTCASWVG